MALTVVAMLLIVTPIVIFRQYKFERELANQLWKISIKYAESCRLSFFFGQDFGQRNQISKMVIQYFIETSHLSSKKSFLLHNIYFPIFFYPEWLRRHLKNGWRSMYCIIRHDLEARPLYMLSLIKQSFKNTTCIIINFSISCKLAIVYIE